MTRRSTILFLAIVVFGLAINHGACAQQSSPAASPTQSTPGGIVSATVITVHGKVLKVNKVMKQVTLELPGRRQITLDVQNPYNLQQAKVGAPFVAHYYEVVTVQKKKPGEKVPAASLKTGIATSAPGGTPGAVGTMHARILVTVDAIDEAKGTVTVKAADGSVETVKARDPQNLKRLKVGDQLIVGISRVVGITLAKESPS